MQVEFVEQKLGTGAMITSAKSSEVDVIIALTEGLVAGTGFAPDDGFWRQELKLHLSRQT